MRCVILGLNNLYSGSGLRLGLRAPGKLRIHIAHIAHNLARLAAMYLPASSEMARSYKPNADCEPHSIFNALRPLNAAQVLSPITATPPNGLNR